MKLWCFFDAVPNGIHITYCTEREWNAFVYKNKAVKNSIKIPIWTGKHAKTPEKRKTEAFRLRFWQGQKDFFACGQSLSAALHTACGILPDEQLRDKHNIQAEQISRIPPRVANNHRTVIHHRSPSSPPAHSKRKRNDTLRAPFLFLWQGQKDLNPRPMVLETSTLPTELYPYTTLGIILIFIVFVKMFW